MAESTIVVELRGKMNSLHMSSHVGDVPCPFPTQTASVSSCGWLNGVLSDKLFQSLSSCNTGQESSHLTTLKRTIMIYWLWLCLNTGLALSTVISTDVTGKSVFSFTNLLTIGTIVTKLRGEMDCFHVTLHGREVTSGFATDAASVCSSQASDGVLQSGFVQGPSPSCS